MAWFSRDKKAPTSDAHPADSTPGAAGPPPAVPTEGVNEVGGTGSPGPEMGKFGPKVTITAFDDPPAELGWQLPLNGELFKLIAGPDRPDYSVMVLERPLHFYPSESFELGRLEEDQRTQDRRGRPMARVHALLVCARFVGQQLHPGMSDVAVNVAYVIDNSLARDELVDFAKIEYAATGVISEGHRESAADQQAQQDEHEGTAEPQADGEPAIEPAVGQAPLEPGEISDDAPPAMVVMGETFAQVARTLRAGIAEQRGEPVENLTVTLTLDEQHRVTGLTGNADGQPPLPTPDTFEQLNVELGELGGLPPNHALAQLVLTVEGESFGFDVQYRN